MGRVTTRYPDWEYRLGCFVESVKDRPRVLSRPLIKPSDWDCGRFVCESILRITGRPVYIFAHCYQSWRGLILLLGDNDYFDQYVRERMAEAEIPEIPVEDSRKGDVLVVKTPFGKRGVAIRMGEMCAAPGDTGLEYAPVSMALTAYQIG